MIYIILSIAVAYLLGLAILGNIFVSWLLQAECKRRKIRPLLMHFLTVIQFCFGSAGIVILPAFLYGKIKANLSSEIGIIFAVTEFAVLWLVFLAVKELNKKLKRFEEPEVADTN